MNGEECLSVLHREMTRILSVFIRICEKYSFVYYAGYGTALGAVRHHGMIPWDDDLDVLMPRDDYNRFLKVVKNELPDDWGLVSEQTEYQFDCLWCKIQNFSRKDIAAVEAALGDKFPQGLYIDIFPLNAVPDSVCGKLIRDFHCKLALLRAKADIPMMRNDGWRSRLARFVALFVPRWLIPQFRSREEYFDYLWNRVLVFPKYGKTKMVSPRNLSSQLWAPFNPIEVDWLADGEMMKFEDIEIRVPKEWDKYLTHFYGDWRKYPPESERIRKHSVEAVAPWKFGLTRCAENV